MKTNKCLIFDGAMGTYYASKGRPYSIKDANIHDCNTILGIHKEYIASGAKAISTNTFGISDLDNIKAGIEIAKSATIGTDVSVFGCIGPIIGCEYEHYQAIIDTMFDNGLDKIIFETFSDIDMIEKLSRYARIKSAGSYLLASLSADANGYTSQGNYYLRLVNRLKTNKNISAYGLNCQCGPLHMYNLATRLDTSDTISIMPNAGYPSYIEGVPTFTENAEYFADKMLDFYNLGVKILGGCCGTTPLHIKYMSDKIKQANEPNKLPTVIGVIDEESTKTNKLERLLKSEVPTIIVEYDAPANVSGEAVTQAIRHFEMAGADAISIADNPLGRSRVNAGIIASRVVRDTGLIAVPHITCRDRNFIGTGSLLLGLELEGITNVLCVSGDPISNYTEEKSKTVFDFNSFSLINYISNFNQGPIKKDFYIGCALNVNSMNFDKELKRAKTKVEKGAGFCITQPCFNLQCVENVKRAQKELGVPIVVGLMPIISQKNAIFINNEISGIDIAPEIVERYADKDINECAILSIELLSNIVSQLKGYVSGFHIINPIKGEDIVLRLIRRIKEL